MVILGGRLSLQPRTPLSSSFRTEWGPLLVFRYVRYASPCTRRGKRFTDRPLRVQGEGQLAQGHEPGVDLDDQRTVMTIIYPA
jgi:hypothetical protein